MTIKQKNSEVYIEKSVYIDQVMNCVLLFSRDMRNTHQHSIDVH